MFRVVADQLKISEGWVRCGHCGDVFDATLYLQPWTPPGGEAETEGVAQADASPGYDPDAEPETAIMEDAEMAGEWAALEGSRGAYEALDDTPALATPLPSERPAAPPAVHGGTGVDEPPGADPIAGGADSEVSDFHTDLQRFAAGVGRTPAEELEIPAEQEAAPTAAAIDGAALVSAEAAPPLVSDLRSDSALDEPDAVPGFVQQARRRAFWQSPGMRAVLLLLVLLLGALLAGQWALHERDRLAAARPDLQPLLQRACDALGCQLAPLRRIDAIVIDSTALVRRLGDFYSFDLVLKNTATTPLALPALELSLTDTRDQVIARRVFPPEEWPDAPSLLPAQGTVTVSLRLAIALGEATPMAGYRALVFYP